MRFASQRGRLAGRGRRRWGQGPTCQPSDPCHTRHRGCAERPFCVRSDNQAESCLVDQNGGSRSFCGITVGCGVRSAPAGFTAGGTSLGRTQRPGGVHAPWLVLTGRRQRRKWRRCRWRADRDCHGRVVSDGGPGIGVGGGFPHVAERHAGHSLGRRRSQSRTRLRCSQSRSKSPGSGRGGTGCFAVPAPQGAGQAFEVGHGYGESRVAATAQR